MSRFTEAQRLVDAVFIEDGEPPPTLTEIRHVQGRVSELADREPDEGERWRISMLLADLTRLEEITAADTS